MLLKPKYLNLLSLFACAGSLLCPSVLAADKPSVRTDKVSPIQIIRIEPSNSDLKRIERKRQQAGGAVAGEAQLHLVKIYLHMPPPSAQGCSLYIGDEPVREYGGFAEGVFFKVYDVGQLESWQGKPVRALYRKEMIDLKVTMPAKPDKTPAKLPALAEALRSGDSP